jgi:Arc/MetJ-type ribon-helix-helix transcriptional regulator
MVEYPMVAMHELQVRPADSEKLTINIGYIDLGRIELLVKEGFYSNRTDFIRTAIRNQLNSHKNEVGKSVIRHNFELGLCNFSRTDLEAAKAAGERLNIRVLGLATIAPDVSPALARATIESITVLGAFYASRDVKAALVDRIH